MIRRVACAISGGVDSAVSALLLKKKGFDVVGVFMINWDHLEEGDSNCSRTQDQLYAESVCRRLGIELHVVNFVKEYWNTIFINLINGYQKGLTLVPDTECNRIIKFGSLHDYVRNELKIDAIATGHYAQNSWGNFLERRSAELPRLCIARDAYKDQTYFLSSLNYDQLSRSMFPVGNLMKTEVKKIAEENGFDDISKKKESMGICFVGRKKNFEAFLEKYIKPKPGPIIEIESGRVIGEHKGTHNYTLGKRVTVDEKIFPNHEGLFVIKCDTENNTIYACLGSFNRRFYARRIRIGPIHWISEVLTGDKFNLQFRCQRTYPIIECEIERMNESESILTSKLPIRATAPGQNCIFYKGNVCMGSAMITDILQTL